MKGTLLQDKTHGGLKTTAPKEVLSGGLMKGNETVGAEAIDPGQKTWVFAGSEGTFPFFKHWIHLDNQPLNIGNSNGNNGL